MSSSNNPSIRSKIANFESHKSNDNRQRRYSRGSNNDPSTPAVASSQQMMQQPKSSKEQQLHGSSSAGPASTVAASQNRISRLRQQQAKGRGKGGDASSASTSSFNNGKTAEQHGDTSAATNLGNAGRGPGGRMGERRLMERKHTKKGRLMKHRQHRASAAEAAAASSAATHERTPSSQTTASASSNAETRGRKRSTKYQTNPSEPSAAVHSEMNNVYSEGPGISSNAPNRTNYNTRRQPMIQRLQKMKEKDNVKQQQQQQRVSIEQDHNPGRASVADSMVSTMSAATGRSSATTAVADQNLSSNHNHSSISSSKKQYSLSRMLKKHQAEPQSSDHRPQQHNNRHHHERRRKDLRERRKSDMQRSGYHQSTATSAGERDESHSPPPNHDVDDNGYPIFSPNFQNANSLSQLASSSPRSGIDILSEDNLDANASFNASSDHVTDDEATLTSVRRIMAAKNVPDSPLHGDIMPAYQALQSNKSPSRGTDISIDDPIIQPAKIAHNRALHHRHQHQEALKKNGRSGEDYNPHSPTVRTKSSDFNTFNATSMTRSPTEHEGNSLSAYHNNRRRREWIIEEKSDKLGGLDGPNHGVFAASSSDYDTDGDISKTSKASKASKTSRHSHSLVLGPSNSQATDANDFFTRSKYSQSKKVDDDDNTFETYEDHDDDSAGSFISRRRKEKQRRQRESVAAAAAAASQKMSKAPTTEEDQSEFQNLMNKDDVEHYTGSLDDPLAKVGIGLAGAVAASCLFLGPAGLLVGAAAVGVGVGVMQIPEEKRDKLQSKAKKKFDEFQEKAVEATSSCGAAYNDSAMAEHIPLPQCPTKVDSVADNDNGSTRSEKIRGTTSDAGTTAKGVKTKQPVTQPGPQQHSGIPSSPTPSSDKMRNKKVACLRNVGILPASQIHGLDPAAQPRAWLDVIASANTTGEEKIEAIEEILILAKDKRRARIFLDEGILDWIIWTLSRYFEKTNADFRDVNWAHPDVTPTEKQAAKLAAMCCVTLGKAHCAAIHTEGDLLLMSMYERGTVPEVRQVAQMLHEVPHHIRITKTSDPTIIDPSKEVFSLRTLTLPQAEELARSVMEVAHGRI